MKLPALLLFCCTILGASAQQEIPRLHGIPTIGPLEACNGKKEGELAYAVNPRGESISGVCKMRLVLVPDRPRNGAPPPPAPSRQQP